MILDRGMESCMGACARSQVGPQGHHGHAMVAPPDLLPAEPDDPKAFVMQVKVAVQRYKGQMQRSGKQFWQRARVLYTYPPKEER